MNSPTKAVRVTSESDLPEKSTSCRAHALPVAGVVAGLAGLGAAAWFGMQKAQTDALSEARDAAQRAACAYAPTLASYDAANLDTYFAAVLAGATGAWHDEFHATSRDLREVLEQGRVVSTVDSVQCAIESADESAARAVVVIGQTITSAGTAGEPRPGQLAVGLSLRKVGDAWLVDEVSSPALPRP